ncbi:hypothetical protein E1B28_007366 [Marasmius oreades]|uniref:Uncharacterized protein n=1 Tax=Marasmius oreades TaxID=181124 RepID=A0A9P7S261_9AGAR|nr:uncharacterized protein E1B28_007366 [Marasmius oreades]KAG7093712.1 hypothetical protein E1B28_007366 [Marasmius oreades]
MSSKLSPNPEQAMVIRELVPNVITTCSTPFLRFKRFKIGGRGTLVRMNNGSVAVFSPIALTEEVKQKVASMGEVKYITALDFEHHMFLGPWNKEYPNAKVIGPEGLPEKRKKQGDEDVPFNVIFEASKNRETRVDPEFDAEFDYEYVHAHSNKELVFNHKPTKTLIEADLIFNLPALEQHEKSGIDPNSGILTKIFNSLMHTRGEALAQKRVIWYGTSAKDRNAFNDSMARINAWDFERLIPCHGEVVEKDAKTVFQKIMQWHLEAARKSQ